MDRPSHRPPPDFARRALLQGAGACVACALGLHAQAAVLPTGLTPHVEPGYQPTDADERGLWHACEQLEREVAGSNFLIKDPGVNAYVRGITERLIDDVVQDMRIYVVRNPEFNASMAPNGMMLVHSGLLVRADSEAQLAAVLGHESGHYLRRHSVQGWRDQKRKSAIAAFASVAAAGVSSPTNGYQWMDVANSISLALGMSLFSFSRELETEADAYGLQLLGRAGYAPGAAAEIWAQLIAERKASAAARNKRYKDWSRSSFSTHPPTENRMQDLRESAKAMPDAEGDHGRQRHHEALAPIRSMLLEEQVRLNDPGANLYLLNRLANDRWDGTLRYYEGEVYRLRDETDDAQRAANAFALAVAEPDAPPEAHRAHGYALLKAGRNEEGRQALARYLELAPDAKDAAMVRFTMAQ
jgi:predicted Zn-dependent protease